MIGLYELLQIGPNADASEVKRAWARMVRQHPPDKDPEMNRQLNEAKATLLDPIARADYDAQVTYGEELTSLMESAQESMAEEDWNDAVVSLKLALTLHPGSFTARNLLGLCYLHLEDFINAEKQLSRLVSEAPASALYYAHLGHVYLKWAEEDDSKYQRGEYCFKKAIEAEPFNATNHLWLSRAYARQRRYKDAEMALEAAVGADGKVDIDDIDALMELTWVYMFSKQQHRIPEVAERIAGVLPDDPEAREYASFRFLREAAMLQEKHNAYQESLSFIRAARKIQSDFGEATDAVLEMERIAKADDQADRMNSDSNIHPPVVPALIAAVANRRLGFEPPEGYIEKLLEALVTWSNSEIRAAISQCRSKYPDACYICSDVISDLQRAGTMSSGPSYQSQSGCGSVLMLMTVCAALVVSLLSIL